MLFNFRLRNLAHVVPWGTPEAPTLHWFGLTDGEYWIEAGEQTLFEYSVELQREMPHAPRYCDYQVARLYEDILEMCPRVLENVPEDLAKYLDFERWGQLEQRLKSYDRPETEDQYWSLLDDLMPLASGRDLDNGYLSPGASIRMWSEGAHVSLAWDCRGRMLNGVKAWSANAGRHKVSKSMFVEEVRSFHERLMEAMSERVQAVMQGELSHVSIDLPGLVREHRRRAADISQQLSPPSIATPWEKVRLAIETLLRADNGT